MPKLTKEQLEDISSRLEQLSPEERAQVEERLRMLKPYDPKDPTTDRRKAKDRRKPAAKKGFWES